MEIITRSLPKTFFLIVVSVIGFTVLRIFDEVSPSKCGWIERLSRDERNCQADFNASTTVSRPIRERTTLVMPRQNLKPTSSSIADVHQPQQAIAGVNVSPTRKQTQKIEIPGGFPLDEFHGRDVPVEDTEFGDEEKSAEDSMERIRNAGNDDEIEQAGAS